MEGFYINGLSSFFDYGLAIEQDPIFLNENKEIKINVKVSKKQNLYIIRKWILKAEKIWFDRDINVFFRIEKVGIKEIETNSFYSVLEVIFYHDGHYYTFEGDETIHVTSGFNNIQIYNNTPENSLPYLKIFGNGRITINTNEKDFLIDNVQEYVIVDGILYDVYDKKGLKNLDTMGDFPELKPENNIIKITGNVSKVELKTNGRQI